MISLKSLGTFSSAGLLSAIAASLCCITPVIALLAGSSSIAANFSWIEPARPYLIGLSIAVLAFAWYMILKPTKTNDMDCNCETTKKPSFRQSKKFLSIITVFAILMMAFPLYAKVFFPKPKTQATMLAVVDNKQQVKFTIQGMSCAGCELEVNNELSKVNGVIAYKTSYAGKSSLVTFDKSKVDVKTIEAAINKTGYTVKSYVFMNASSAEVSFYEAPLVCHAAPSIGCGSKAKFMLVDLEKYNDAVEGAWLNKTGTVVAVKWNASTNESKQTEIINVVSTSHNIALNPVPPSEASNYAKSFPNSSQWFKGKAVDQLSKEEAQIIAKNTIAGYKKDGLVKPSFEKQFQADIAKIYENLFLSISSYKELTTEAYNKVEEDIQQAGEKYVGKGKMPRVELCEASEEKCEKDKSCSQGSGKSCCDKEQ
ncbi:mercuric transport protein MerTP [Panacibacter ginsenosidivorans]|uniref:Mercuric transport protein MerT n=1 Tax=Panacibacter ginsenosidivorans TaxID=1813871 RepID=A0A5B8VD69_9BACT|nr:mercuric transport protein MerTP [Panacibacter ginsenosidivorans]QEC69262.1 mercuric transport protein MerTP [Panacibacter ginsenosidivorans]